MAGVALVTGASRGIGAAVAVALGRAGYKVCVNFVRRHHDAENVVQKIQSVGGLAFAVAADVSDEKDVSRMFEELDKKFGCISVLINNAGLRGPRGRIEQAPLNEVRRLFAVNVEGCILCVQQAVKRMSTRYGGRGGSIINISSGAANFGNPNTGIAYAMTKGALSTLTTGLSQELGREGIRVNSVLPGPTLTDFIADREGADHLASAIPMGRLAHPDEIAEAVVWMVSEKAGYVSGAHLRVAGGRI